LAHTSCLSLHDALPICGDPGHGLVHRARTVDQLHLLGAVELEGVEAELAVAADLLDQVGRAVAAGPAVGLHPVTHAAAEKLVHRSEEHTSELQSRENLV